MGDLTDAMATTEKKFLGMPKWRLGVYAVILLFGVAYLLWSFLRKPAAAPGHFQIAPPAVAVAKVVGPIVHVPIQIVPKQAVEKKYPALAPILADPDEEAIDTADIPATPNGVQTVTFLNVSTGVVTTTYTAKPAPWFAFEGDNALGVQRQWSNQGASTGVYYRRSIVRIKDLHLIGTAGLDVPDQGKANYHAGIAGEYRW